MKLRETDQINDGVSLGRVVEVSDEHGQGILDLQASRGYTAWEKAPKNATVNATLFPVDEADVATNQTQAQTPATPAATTAE